MKAKTLSVKLNGAEDDGGDVVLGDLKDFVSALTTCLKRVERKFEDGPRLDYRVVGLSRGSACLKVVPVTQGQDTTHGPLVIGLFVKTVRDLETGSRIDPRMTSSDLLEFKKLVAPVKNKARGVVVNRLPLTDKFESNITRLLESASISEGSAKGTVERVNVHNKHEFVLFPIIGEPIACQFPESLFEKVRGSLKKTATVYGKMYRYFGNVFPERAKVTDIDIHPSDDDLPRLSDLHGAMAGSFGDEGSVEFLRKLRDAK
jgi:hypothetical protein